MLRRLLVLAPTPFFGDRGCHVRIYEEARALARLGVESTVVTYPTGRTPDEVAVRRSMRLPGLTVPDLGPDVARPLFDAGVFAAAIRVIRQWCPQAIHAHLHEGIVIGAALRRLLSVPVVGDLQGSLAAEMIDHRVLPATGSRIWAVRQLERRVVRLADAVVSSSPVGAALLCAQGVPAHRVQCLPDGVDLGRFRPARPDPALRHALGLHDGPTIAFLGVLTEYQGVDTLIESVPHVLRRHPRAQFLIMGYPNEERYRAMVRDRALDHAVRLTGRIPYADAPRHLSLGTVAVSAKQSLTEANGKLVNYMACGLPVVATDTPVNRAALGDHGVYVRVGDSVDLAAGLAGLLDRPAEREARGWALRARAEQQFDWSMRIQPLASLLERVVSGAVNRVYASEPEPAATV